MGRLASGGQRPGLAGKDQQAKVRAPTARVQERGCFKRGFMCGMLLIMVKHYFIGMALVFIGLAVACGSPLNGNGVKQERFAFEERHMGTLFRIVLYAPDEATAKKAARAAFERVAQLDGIMSD